MSLLISHHLLLCVTPVNSSCCVVEESIKSWEQLKKILRDLKLEDPKRQEGIVLRSKVNCLRICKQGPILLIWPDGIWYHKVSPNLVERIVKQHIVKGEPINEFIFRRTPLNKRY